MFNFIKKFFQPKYGKNLCFKCRVYDHNVDECCHQKNIVKKGEKYVILLHPMEKNPFFQCKDYEEHIL